MESGLKVVVMKMTLLTDGVWAEGGGDDDDDTTN